MTGEGSDDETAKPPLPASLTRGVIQTGDRKMVLHTPEISKLLAGGTGPESKTVPEPLEIQAQRIAAIVGHAGWTLREFSAKPGQASLAFSKDKQHMTGVITQDRIDTKSHTEIAEQLFGVGP